MTDNNDLVTYAVSYKDLIEAINQLNHINFDTYNDYNTIYDILENLPLTSIYDLISSDDDLEIVKHTYWVHDPYEPPKCSQCGQYSLFEENYCANCGAKMDQEEPKQ